MHSVQVTPAEVADWRAGHAVHLLDVREPWEVQLVSFAEAQTIPLAQLAQRWEEVPEDRRVVVVCHHGMRSLQATMFLRGRGLDNVWNLAGGIDAYAAQVDTTLARY
ncbi:MAG: sulfurtransferase [Alphaproteobacteria bacterium]|nr:rhodanese-like domain-containing protein [Alphaproteobacteria bacterium]TAD86569.1 MAG: sulfurtransferase [Alphaproteobacteria bacterium]